MRGLQAIGAGTRFEAPGIAHLHRVAHADREDQEGHQHRHRIDAVAEQGQQAEQPDHRQQRREQGQQAHAPRARIAEQQHRGDREREREKAEHAARACADVADRFRKADDVHVDLRIGVLRADGFEPLRDLEIIESPAGVRIGFEQFAHDEGAMQIVRDQTPDFVRAQHIGAHAGHVRRCARVIGRHDVAAREARFDDLDVARIRREQGAHRRPVDAGHEEDRIGRIAQLGKESGVEHFAVALDQGYEHPVRTTEGRAVLREGLHVRVRERHHLVEARIDAQPDGACAQQHGHQGEDREQRAPMREDRAGQGFDAQCRAHFNGLPARRPDAARTARDRRPARGSGHRGRARPQSRPCGRSRPS